MRYSTTLKRLEALESGTSARVLAWQDGDAADVTIAGTGERMPAAVFLYRYPAGLICRWFEDEDTHALPND